MSSDDTERIDKRPDPSEDPRACSVCGVYIGFGGDEYCDGCARDIGAKPPLQRCVHCGQRGPEEQMNPIDVSGADEYYPKFKYLCPSCSGGGSA
jgi:hypothetical protein